MEGMRLDVDFKPALEAAAQPKNSQFEHERPQPSLVVSHYSRIFRLTLAAELQRNFYLHSYQVEPQQDPSSHLVHRLNLIAAAARTRDSRTISLASWVLRLHMAFLPDQLEDVQLPSPFRPSLFETVAGEGLGSLMKLSFDHVFRVATENNEWLRPLGPWASEIFFGLRYLLEAHYLRDTGATFAENMYGLKRFRVGPEAPAFAGDIAPQHLQELGVGDRRRALFWLVAAPYLRLRLERHYLWLTRAVGHRPAGPGLLEDDYVNGVLVEDPLSPPVAAQVSGAVVAGRRAFVRVYPWLNGSWELLSLVWHLRYLFKRTLFATPALWALGQHLRRLSTTDLMTQARRSLEGQERTLQSLRRLYREGPAAGSGLLRRLWFPAERILRRLSYLLRYYGKWGVALAVLGFQVLEWWYSPVNQHAAAGLRSLPSPPPPPQVPVPPGGLPLHQDRQLCPLCQRRRTNPAATPAGYVFCFPCIHDHLQKDGRCPVSLLSCQPQELRRVFES